MSDFHDSNRGQKLLYWVSLLAMGLTLAGALRKAAR